MTTLFDAQPARTADGASRLGVIASRQLVAVQTFDIARLTSHPVAIIPSSFVAVTGRGPRDSNESGKTSFNAAVALLLGDPEWRVSGGGVATVAELLFEPDTAGVAGGAPGRDLAAHGRPPRPVRLRLRGRQPGADRFPGGRRARPAGPAAVRRPAQQLRARAR
jgi:hypothetical protein